MNRQSRTNGQDDRDTRRQRITDSDVSCAETPKEMQRSHCRTQTFAAMADRILELQEQLRCARSQLASYGRTLFAIQRSVLPQRLPEVPGLDLAVHFAEVEEAGGDFYDVALLEPESWAIVVADVSGHGLAAAAVMALTHALGHALQEQATPPSPGAALALVNGALASRYLVNSGQFVTAFAGRYEARTQVLRYAAAGHPPPRLIRDYDVRRLDAASGIPLGVDGESFYQEAAIQLGPGDRLVFFTDGITEGINAAGEMFGDQRLDEALRTPATRPAELLDRIVRSRQAFRAGLPPSDDETCLVAFVKTIGATFESESEVVR